MDIKDRAIGIYDSGIGGLATLLQLKRAMPEETFIYFADTAWLPYGDKSVDQILSRTSRIIEWMETIPVKLIIAACNTSSALAIPTLQKSSSLPLVGIIEPLRHLFSSHVIKKGIVVLATQATASSGIHASLFKHLGLSEPVRSIGCPKLVPLIESGVLEGLSLTKALTEYLSPISWEEVDFLLYGCTHYPWIHSSIASLVPSDVFIIDPTLFLLQEMRQILTQFNLGRSSSKTGEIHFYCSGSPEVFLRACRPVWQGASVVDLPFLSASQIVF